MLLCIPQVLEIPHDLNRKLKLEFDAEWLAPEWLAILKISSADHTLYCVFLSCYKHYQVFLSLLHMLLCIPQVLEIPHGSNKELKLELDAEWLAILKITNHLFSLSKSYHYPGSGEGER